MYANDIIRSFENIYIRKSTVSPLIHVFKVLNQKIKDSSKFYFGEAVEVRVLFEKGSKYPSKTTSFKPDSYLSHLRLPYPLCWFDFDTSMESESYDDKYIKETRKIMKEMGVEESIRRGYLVWEVIPNLLLGAIAFGLAKNDQNIWSFTPISYYISLDGEFGKNDILRDGILNDIEIPNWVNTPSEEDTDQGRLNTMIHFMKKNPRTKTIIPIPMIDPDNVREIVPQHVMAGDIQGLNLLEQSIRLLNCKNIISEVVDRSFVKMKIGKKIKKVKTKHKHRYHILKAVTPKTYKKYINSSKSGRTVSVHMCKGHIRTYDPITSKGMFGKGLYGDFWIPDHIRGNKKKGLVTKDYHVIPNPELITA